MPIVEINENDILPQKSPYDMQAERDPAFSEIFKAHFETDNVVNNASKYIARKAVGSFYDGEADPNYDVFTDLGGYEAYAQSFIGVESKQEADRLKQKIDEENEARSIMASGSTVENLTAGLLNGLVDPINFIPVGGAAYKTYRTGGNILEGAARTALIGGTAMVAEEVALQAMQETRTLEESLANVAGATLLSGVLGGTASAFTRAELNDLAQRLEQELVVPTRVDESTAGAQQVVPTTLEQETLKGALGLEKALSFQDPVLRTLNSPSKVTRQMSEKLAETALIKNKNVEGIASEISVENKMKGYNAFKAKFFTDYEELFLKYRGEAGRRRTAIKDKFGKARRDGKLTYREFGEEVIKAARRGDTHEIPEVAKAAKSLRDEVFDPIYKKAVEAGVLEEGIEVKTAPSYVTRLWDRFKIEADLPKFKEINQRWLIEKRNRAIVELQEFKAKFAKEIEAKDKKIIDEVERLQWRASFEDAELSNIVDELTDRITGTPAGRLPYDMKLQKEGSAAARGRKAQFRGAARERVYDIPDEMVEDFLVNDVDAIVQSYTRSLSSDIEIVKAFGNLDMEKQYKAIQEDYARLSKNADAKTQRKLKKQKDSDLRDMKAMYERLRGTYAQPDDYAGHFQTAGRIAKNWNYLTLLGGMIASAFPDIARPVMVNGLGRVYKDGIQSFVKNRKAFIKAAKEVKEAGTALDMVLDTRARALADMDEYMPMTNRLEEGLSAASANFGLVSLMSPWNAAMKQFTGVITQSRIIDAVTKGTDTEKLATNFIDKNMAARIKDQFQKYGQTEDGVKIPNARAWDDIEARETFRAAIRREVDLTIVTPGQDKPLWMSRPGLDLIGQFKSFAVGSVQRTLLLGLQQRDAGVLNGAMLMAFLGMGTYGTKVSLAGHEVSDDWRVWLTEGVDRSGLTGWFFEANNLVEKVTRGRVGVNALIGGPPMSRYASRSALEAMAGPTYGTLGNIIQATGSAFAGDWRKSDTHAVRRLMPYQNLIYARKIFDEAEEALNNTLGIDK